MLRRVLQVSTYKDLISNETLAHSEKFIDEVEYRFNLDQFFDFKEYFKSCWKTDRIVYVFFCVNFEL